MNSDARKLLDDARQALKEEPDRVWPAAVVELAGMLSDREKQLAALQRQIGAFVQVKPSRACPAQS